MKTITALRPLSPLPAELPATPTGWSRRTCMLKLVDGGALTLASVFDDKGREMPFAFTSDTRPGGREGFTLPDVPHPMGWNALRAEWPRWLERTDSSKKDSALRAAMDQEPR